MEISNRCWFQIKYDRECRFMCLFMNSFYIGKVKKIIFNRLSLDYKCIVYNVALFLILGISSAVETLEQ